MKKKPVETDLYAPLRTYLTAQGYSVQGEVKHCDIAAVKGESLIVIETKLALNLALVAQGVRRQQATDSVYLAVPRPPNRGRWMRQMRGAFRVLKRLELGLLLVSLKPRKPAAGSEPQRGARSAKGSSGTNPPVPLAPLSGKTAVVEVIFHPLPSERRKRGKTRRAILEEIGRRSGDYNLGGSTRRPLVTAYRENAVQIACYLADSGTMAPRQLRALGTGPKTRSILYSDVYGWFSRVAHGLYDLSPKGRDALPKYPELVRHYRSLPVTQSAKPDILLRAVYT